MKKIVESNTNFLYCPKRIFINALFIYVFPISQLHHVHDMPFHSARIYRRTPVVVVLLGMYTDRIGSVTDRMGNG